MNIKFNAFKAFSKSLSGQTLRTLTKNAAFEFIYEASTVNFIFTPLSSSKPRTEPKEFMQKRIDQFNTNGNSMIPVDYNESYNASYLVTLFSLYQNHLQT